MSSIQRQLIPIIALALALGGLAGTAAAQVPSSSPSDTGDASSSTSGTSDGSSGAREPQRRSLFNRPGGVKWATHMDPKDIPWDGLTPKQMDPAKEQRRVGLRDWLKRGRTGSAPSAVTSPDRGIATAGSGVAARSAKPSASESSALVTKTISAGAVAGGMPKTATAASFTSLQDSTSSPPAAAFAPTPPAATQTPGGQAPGAADRDSAARALEKELSEELKQTQPLESLPQPILPSPFSPTGAPTTVEENGAIAQPPSTALRLNAGETDNFCRRFLQGYPTLASWFPEHIGKPPEEPDEPEPPRRAPPSPWDSPPFPMSEYQGYPLIGVPPGTIVDPLMSALYRGRHGDWLKQSRIEMHGWVTSSGVWGNAKHSNTPDAYWIVPNSYQLDQLIVKLEREIDTVQTDHIDWGFRSVSLYGIDYRYTTAGGWFSNQLLKHNSLYGWDPVEQYIEIYVPRIWEGFVFRLGRWIACPDIETQYAPDNYMGSHSLLFTFDTYTQTGAMFSFQMTQRLMLQAAIESGTDMAPWYPGATPTLFAGCRWVSEDNNNAFYTCLNNYNNSHFRYFMQDGHLAGHDNFNYIVSTYEHRFSKKVHTKTEAYYMWQVNAVVGGTPSFGPTHDFGGGGGFGRFLPGTSKTYGVLNYTPFQLSDRDYFVIRNEWWRDERGERSGFPTNYSSHAIALSHQFNDVMMIRPEIGFYHSYDVPAFDLGRRNSLLIYGFDLTFRF